MMPAAIGFGAIKEDDEFLDMLGARQAGPGNDLEGIFAAWTASIDADECASAARSGPLGIRQDDVAGARPVRVVRLPRARVVGILGALVLTVSGGGVAAAIGQVELTPVRDAITRATRPVLVAQAQAPTVASSLAPVSPTVDTVAALPALVEKARTAASTGEVQKAIGMMEVIRSLAPQDAAGEQITAQVEQLEQQIVATAPEALDPSTTDGPTTSATSPSDAVTRTTSAPAPVPATDSPTATASPARPSTTAPSASSTATAETPVPPRTSAPSSTTAPSSAPTSPATTTPSTIGSATSQQRPGTATAPARATNTATASGPAASATTDAERRRDTSTAQTSHTSTAKPDHRASSKADEPEPIVEGDEVSAEAHSHKAVGAAGVTGATGVAAQH